MAKLMMNPQTLVHYSIDRNSNHIFQAMNDGVMLKIATTNAPDVGVSEEVT